MQICGGAMEVRASQGNRQHRLERDTITTRIGRHVSAERGTAASKRPSVIALLPKACKRPGSTSRDFECWDTHSGRRVAQLLSREYPIRLVEAVRWRPPPLAYGENTRACALPVSLTTSEILPAQPEPTPWCFASSPPALCPASLPQEGPAGLSTESCSPPTAGR